MKIGDTVFVLGRYLPCGETQVVEAKIDHIEHRQFVAYNAEHAIRDGNVYRYLPKEER